MDSDFINFAQKLFIYDSVIFTKVKSIKGHKSCILIVFIKYGFVIVISKKITRENILL